MSAVAEEVAAIPKELCAIPGLGSLILIFRRSASKAVGEDWNGGELFAAASDSMARIFHHHVEGCLDLQVPFAMEGQSV